MRYEGTKNCGVFADRHLTGLLLRGLFQYGSKRGDANHHHSLARLWRADRFSAQWIEQFNQTVGKEQRINVQVTSVSNTNTIHELVLAAANGEPGAPELPDLFVSYPKTVMALPDDSILVDYRDWTTSARKNCPLSCRLSWKRGSSMTGWWSFPWRNPQRSCISTRRSSTASPRRPA